jgi:uncharacterized membrane protein
MQCPELEGIYSHKAAHRTLKVVLDMALCRIVMAVLDKPAVHSVSFIEFPHGRFIKFYQRIIMFRLHKIAPLWP